MIRADGVEIKHSLFPNKEIKLPEIEKAYVIEWYFESIEELFVLQCIPKDKQCTLFMPYIPFSRMDRQVDEQFFTLPVFCGIINRMEFKEVIVLEAHSDVSVNMLDRVSNRHTSMSMFADRFENYDAIVFPDAGAAKDMLL